MAGGLPSRTALRKRSKSSLGNLRKSKVTPPGLTISRPWQVTQKSSYTSRPRAADVARAARLACSNLLLPQRRHLNGRDPRLVGPRHTFARNLRVDEVGLTFDRRLACARERLPQLPRTLDHLAIDAETFGDRGHVHVRAAKIIVHELAGLYHAATRHVGNDARMRSTIGVIVIDDDDYREFEPRHVPERGRAEDEGAVADETNHLLVRPREFHSRRRADAGTEMGTVIEEQLAPTVRVEVE